MKHKKLFLIGSTFILATVVSSLALNFNSYPLSKAASSTATVITLDENNAPTIVDGNGTLIYNQFATFNYENVSALAEGHVSLGVNGTINKVQVSNSLSSIVATYTGTDLTINTGFTSEELCFSYELSSGVSQSIRGNYFEITSSSGADITEIVLSFGCESSEAESHHMSAYQSDATNHWKECTDAHCHHVTNYGAHVKSHPDLVAPTTEATGSTGDVVCSTCKRKLEDSRTLPILSDADYDVTYDTRLIEGVVRDVIDYTWKVDSDYVFTELGEILTEYIHAGTSYYSIPRWNEIFPTQTATVTTVDNKKNLTIELDEDTVTTITASDGVSDLDGMLDFTLYNQVTITGDGTMNVSYSTLQDGINAYSLIIDEGTTVNLNGYDATRMSGVKVYKLLQIDGTFNVSNFGHGEAIASNKSGSDYDVTVNIGATGKFDIENCSNGIFAWSSYSHIVNVNVAGELKIRAYSESTAAESLSGTYYGNGICFNKTGCSLTVTGKLDIEATNTNSTTSDIKGYGIRAENGSVYFLGTADVSIICSGNGIYGFKKFVLAGTSDYSTAGAVNLVLKPKRGNGLRTYTSTSASVAINNGIGGSILIEFTNGSPLKTGIEVAGVGSTSDVFMIKAYDMTIKGFGNAMGSWKAKKKQVRTYAYTGDYNKLKVVNCTNLYNAGSTNYGNPTFFSAYTSSTVDIISE